MSTTTGTGRLAVLGGPPAFPDGLPLVRPTIEDVPGLAARLTAVLATGLLTNGPRVRELEERLADRLDVGHVVAVGSCTAGLMLAYQALGVRGPVVLPSFTFAASAHAVHWAGGTPTFAEARESDLTLDPVDAAGVLGRLAAEGRPAAALSATHVYGTPAQTEALAELAAEHGIPLVYDAAHALGSARAGRAVGGFGTVEVFSLSPTKVMSAGEGGIVATEDAELARAVRIGRDYGNPGSYDCEFPGINARMSELHATMALFSLEHLDARVARRNELVEVFRAELDGVPGVRIVDPGRGDVSTRKDLTLVVDAQPYGLNAAQLARVLRAEGVDSRHYYAPPIHRQQAYAGLPSGGVPSDGLPSDGGQQRALPVTDRLASQVISPPLWSHMDDEVARRVARLVVEAGGQATAVREALVEVPG
ncbi:MAG: DegT/DnrJ/EryC1/StrS family aminotransferase [Actinomycetes bacterium]